jgi:alpha-glucosidase
VPSWWEQAVVYQIYPRSFADSNGDGSGDLEGIRQHLDHLADLGVDALWMSPITPSPDADWGYDVSDYTGIHPDFGTLDDFDALVRDAHARGLKVVLDLVPNHTSIEHPWFREHPERYVWADEIPNNWLSVFGGIAWSRDEETGRYYLHSFYPEQPDLDWGHPDVGRAIGDAMRFWTERGADGFRLDALSRIAKDPALHDDPPATEPPVLPLPDEYATLRHVYSRNYANIEERLAVLREAAGGAMLVGEVFVPTAGLAPYLRHIDLAFAFELMFARWDPDEIARILGEGCRGLAWTLSNHDFSRVATRLGDENVRLAATLTLTLPGTAFVYQGDEIGLHDGPGADPPYDRRGRDFARQAMQWTPDPLGGFTTGTPWLPPVDPEQRNVADQRRDPGSLLNLYRELIRLRRDMPLEFDLLGVADGVLSYRRGDATVMLNFAATARPAPARGTVLLATAEAEDGVLPAHGAVITSER